MWALNLYFQISVKMSLKNLANHNGGFLHYRESYIVQKYKFS